MLVDAQGMPLTKHIKRREMKSGQIKKTSYGDILFKLVVDLPKEAPEEVFNKAMYEYGKVIAEAYEKKPRG
jgi:hypothetical protein